MASERLKRQIAKILDAIGAVDGANGPEVLTGDCPICTEGLALRRRLGILFEPVYPPGTAPRVCCCPRGDDRSRSVPS